MYQLLFSNRSKPTSFTQPILKHLECSTIFSLTWGLKQPSCVHFAKATQVGCFVPPPRPGKSKQLELLSQTKIRTWRNQHQRTSRLINRPSYEQELLQKPCRNVFAEPTTLFARNGTFIFIVCLCQTVQLTQEVKFKPVSRVSFCCDICFMRRTASTKYTFKWILNSFKIGRKGPASIIRDWTFNQAPVWSSEQTLRTGSVSHSRATQVTNYLPCFSTILENTCERQNYRWSVRKITFLYVTCPASSTRLCPIFLSFSRDPNGPLTDILGP